MPPKTPKEKEKKSIILRGKRRSSGEGYGEDKVDAVVQDNYEASVRIRGQLERDRLKEAMP